MPVFVEAQLSRYKEHIQYNELSDDIKQAGMRNPAEIYLAVSLFA
jgi:hypothetical protein